jgi:nucleoside-diphosphate-sugar epimerase
VAHTNQLLSSHHMWSPVPTSSSERRMAVQIAILLSCYCSLLLLAPVDVTATATTTAATVATVAAFQSNRPFVVATTGARRSATAVGWRKSMSSHDPRWDHQFCSNVRERTLTTTITMASTIHDDGDDHEDGQNVRRVLVIGGTSGIGQLVTRKLLVAQHRSPNDSGDGGTQPHRYTVRATARDRMRGQELLGCQTNDRASVASENNINNNYNNSNNNNNNIEVVELDLLQDDTTVLQAAMQDVSAVVISIGTTAFPTMKWRGGNTPIAIDQIAVTRIATEASQVPSVRTVILVTSVGVLRTKQMPFVILNLFGVLDAKKAGEDAIRYYSTTTTDTGSGYNYAIVRPGRLIGAPFTNDDVAKLLQIQGGSGGTNGGIVQVEAGDTLLGDCPRDACAECIVQCLQRLLLDTTTDTDTTTRGVDNLEFSIIAKDQQSPPPPAWTNEEWTRAFQSVTR